MRRTFSFFIATLFFLTPLPLTAKKSVVPDAVHLKLVHLNQEIIVPVDVADTLFERELGLKYQMYQSEAKAMYFTGAPLQAFWMKDTWIPLDIIFLNQDYQVTRIVKNAQPCQASACPIYWAPKNTWHAIEFAAGWIDHHGVMTGDVVQLQ